MYAIIVEFTLKPGQSDAFLPLIRENASAALRDEPACHRFDVLIDPAKPETIVLYEVYDDAEALETHRQTPHFQRFAEASADLVESKQIRPYTLVS